LSSSDDGLPGAELIDQGLRDLARGLDSPAAAAIEIVAPRLRLIERSLPRQDFEQYPELVLYQRLVDGGVPDAFSTYNAILRQLMSFASALEREYYAR